MADEESVFEQYEVASWSVGGRPEVRFPVDDIVETGGNRLVNHDRPYRAGSKLDNTGAKARQWSVTIKFNNSLAERGLPETTPLYPTVLRQLLRSFDLQETGFLTLPTVGRVRAQLSDYSRRESSAEIDTATVTVTWTEDNEDALDRAALDPPSVMATVSRLGTQVVLEAQATGVWSEDLATLRERCNELETAMKAPGRAVADVATAARANRRAVESVLSTALTEVGRLGVLGEPRSSGLQSKLAMLSDRVARAEDERTTSRPRTMPWTVDVELTSMYEIAARFDQDAAELIDINAARVPDPLSVTRGDVIKLFVTA